MSIQNNNNSTKNGDNNRMNKNRKNSLILFVATIYFLLAILILIFVAPVALDMLRYVLIEINRDFAIITFLIALTVMITMGVIMIIYIPKLTKRDNQIGSIHKDTEEIKIFSSYDMDRQYLEEKINELTVRLMNSEKKWQDINHLVLAAHNRNITNNGSISYEKFLSEFGINAKDMEVNKELVFVLTPADNSFRRDFGWIKLICSRCKLRAVRGDEEDLSYINNNMLSYILKYIIKARIIIANISNRNPNVYYELGIAHALGKPTILLCRQDSEVPFDLQQRYIIFYKDDEDLSAKLTDALLNILTNE